MYHFPVVVVNSVGDSSAPCAAALIDFADQRICAGAVDALQTLDEVAALVVIADATLDDMDAVELAEVIRDIDAENNRFTYIILTGTDSSVCMESAFAQHVDAFVDPTQPALLTAAVIAGGRIAARINALATDNAALLREREGLRESQLLDSLTGLGNRRFAEHSLRDAIRQVESRGGAVCFMMIAIGNVEEIVAKYDRHIADEFTQLVAQRIQGLVRPMDVACHFGEGVFALVLLQPSIDHCTAECYQRIFDGIRLKSYRSAVGYLTAIVGVSISASHAENGSPNLEAMIRVAESHLDDAVRTQRISVEHLSK
jgi:diguanylate cyclase (GGDEF)-like protein